jgi:hypothetical protein
MNNVTILDRSELGRQGPDSGNVEFVLVRLWQDTLVRLDEVTDS